MLDEPDYKQPTFSDEQTQNKKRWAFKKSIFFVERRRVKVHNFLSSRKIYSVSTKNPGYCC